MKRNGRTSSGRIRWRCRNAGCGSSRTQSRDNSARDLRCGLDWLFSKQSQAGHRLPARTLRRRCELMWSLWPPVPLVDEVHHVVHVDGIHLHRDAVVLIAVAGGHVIGWHVAKSEKAAAWQCLMARIAPPDVLVCDGGGGVLKAAKAMWPDTRIQRCLFHVQANILEPAGRRPRLAPGGPVPAPRRGRGRRGRMAGLLQPVGAGLRLVPRREERIRRRQCERHAPKARQGTAHDPQTHPGGSAVHVPRRGARVRRPGAVHEQPRRIMERAPARHAAPPPRTAVFVFN